MITHIWKYLKTHLNVYVCMLKNLPWFHIIDVSFKWDGQGFKSETSSQTSTHWNDYHKWTWSINNNNNENGTFKLPYYYCMVKKPYEQSVVFLTYPILKCVFQNLQWKRKTNIPVGFLKTLLLQAFPKCRSIIKDWVPISNFSISVFHRQSILEHA